MVLSGENCYVMVTHLINVGIAKLNGLDISSISFSFCFDLLKALLKNFSSKGFFAFCCMIQGSLERFLWFSCVLFSQRVYYFLLDAFKRSLL